MSLFDEVRRIIREELDVLRQAETDGVVEAVEGQYASVRTGGTVALPGFYVPPYFALEPGDRVRVLHRGGYQLVTAVLSRNAIVGTAAASAAQTGSLFLSAAGMWPSVTNGCVASVLVESATNKQSTWRLDFVDAATRYAEATVAMPLDWNGSTVTATFIWLATAANTQVCRWQLEARAYGDGQALDQAWSTAQAVDDANQGAANAVLISPSTPALTVGGSPAAGSLVQWRVGRLGDHANDTLVSDARMLGVQIAYGRV